MAYGGSTFKEVKKWILKMVDENGMKTFKCGLCGKVFKDSSNIRRHMITLHMEASHNPCPNCSAVFSDKYKLCQTYHIFKTDFFALFPFFRQRSVTLFSEGRTYFLRPFIFTLTPTCQHFSFTLLLFSFLCCPQLFVPACPFPRGEQHPGRTSAPLSLTSAMTSTTMTTATSA